MIIIIMMMILLMVMIILKKNNSNTVLSMKGLTGHFYPIKRSTQLSAESFNRIYKKCVLKSYPFIWYLIMQRLL